MRWILANISQLQLLSHGFKSNSRPRIYADLHGSKPIYGAKTKNGSKKERKSVEIRVNPCPVFRLQPASLPAPQSLSPHLDAPWPVLPRPFWPASRDLPAAHKPYLPARLHPASSLQERPRLLRARAPPRYAADDRPPPAETERRLPVSQQRRFPRPCSLPTGTTPGRRAQTTLACRL